MDVPELPEVTALAEALTQRAAGLEVRRIDVAAISALKTFDPPVTAAVGCVVLGFSRRGKHLVLELVDPQGEPLHVVVHLSRAGWARWRDDPPATPAPLGARGGGRGAGSALALRIVFAAGPDGGPAGQPPGAPVAAVDLTEAGTKKRLAVHVVRDPAEVPAVARLGPDPLDDLTPELFHDILVAAGRAQIKGVLRDQSRIAGIGNAYSDEILHGARLSPFAPAGTQSPEVESRLFQALRDTLGHAVTAARAPVVVVIIGTSNRTAVARSRLSSDWMPLRTGVLMINTNSWFLIMSIALGLPSLIALHRWALILCWLR